MYTNVEIPMLSLRTESIEVIEGEDPSLITFTMSWPFYHPDFYLHGVISDGGSEIKLDYWTKFPANTDRLDIPISALDDGKTEPIEAGKIQWSVYATDHDGPGSDSSVLFIGPKETTVSVKDQLLSPSGLLSIEDAIPKAKQLIESWNVLTDVSLAEVPDHPELVKLGFYSKVVGTALDLQDIVQEFHTDVVVANDQQTIHDRIGVFYDATETALATSFDKFVIQPAVGTIAGTYAGATAGVAAAMLLQSLGTNAAVLAATATGSEIGLTIGLAIASTIPAATVVAPLLVAAGVTWAATVYYDHIFPDVTKGLVHDTVQLHREDVVNFIENWIEDHPSQPTPGDHPPQLTPDDDPSQPASESPLINLEFYLQSNPDVASAGVSPADHYENFGWHEGRNPNAHFSTTGYLAANSDVGAANINPLTHYDMSGWKEGRDPSANFDTSLYLEHNPDVAAAGIDPLSHYLEFGKAEGRQTYMAVGQSGSFTHGSFDAEFYLLNNVDVAKAAIASGGNTLEFAYNHYEQFGWHEGRNPNSLFDVNGYLDAHDDVRAAGVDPLTHYDDFGWKEGRDPSGAFDTQSYLSNYTDVAAAQVDPLQHYLAFGIHEGRNSFVDGVIA
ncbi:MAG: hypothetical protein J0I08_11250 [Rhizobiales bacterium]|nr:hypothetical protein [Hyphomicrobiales bacterium]